MKSYSQNSEDLFVLNYFGDYRGNLLSVGENNGIDFSNAKLLIDVGFSAHLLEPGETCVDLMYLHEKNDKITVHNFGIGAYNGPIEFYESGAHIPGGTDKGLVSSALIEETVRWEKAGVEFKQTEILLKTFATFYEGIGRPQFDFISIDAEGFDWVILRQIDLDAVGCKCLCIEWNGNPDLSTKFTQYCKGFKLAHINNENLIFCR